jgi:hypothetical protein
LSNIAGINRQRADMPEDQRVAIRRGARDGLHGDLPGAARLVVDDHRLLPQFSLSFWPTKREITSELPPGANGTTSVTGLAG